MATTSPPPNSTTSAVPPTPTTASPPPSNATATPPQSSTPPPLQPNANPPDPQSPSTPSPQTRSPPPPTPPVASPPPSQPSPSPPTAASPPLPQSVSPASQPPPPPPNSTSPPTSSSPPPSNSSSPRPPPPSNSSSSPPPPPPNSSRSPPPSNSSSSPPPPSSGPPVTSPPSPSNPPQNSPSRPPPPPPPSPQAPESSPPPPSPVPLRSPPPPTASTSPESSPPSPAPVPPQRSPPPPASIPENSPPPPLAVSPSDASPPTRVTPPGSQPTSSPSNSTPTSSPPPPIIRAAPPPLEISVPPSDNSSTNNSDPNVPTNSSGNNGIGAAGMVAIGVAVGVIVISLIGLAVWCLKKRRKEVARINGGYFMPSPVGSSPRSDSFFLKAHSSAPLVGSGSGSDFVYSPSEPGGLGNSRSLYMYEELVKATNGFSTQNLLGEGGFGYVYKGILPDGREVAVKQLKIGGGQGEREFKAEVGIISRIHHRHLVSLVGYCISENRRLLVYDYVPNNNLYFHLHGEGRPVLDWPTRIRIAAGAARGIAYLHEDCHPRIIHRDIKSSNILVDNNFEARVSDFGLAKLALDANTHVTTRVMGTFGYMAPEYASSGKLTEKSDVFSYGVVLLELITGRKPVDSSQPLGDESLVQWARPLLGHALNTGEFDGLTDPRLGRNYIDGEMFRMIEAAAACVRHSAAKRPRMGQVVRAFDSLATQDLTNGMKLGESEMFNSAQQSAEIRLFRRMAFGSQNYSTEFFTQNSWDSREEQSK